MSCLLPKLSMGVESDAKVGEDFAPIALFLIGYVITWEQHVEWVKPSWTLEKLKVFKIGAIEKGGKHIIVSMNHVEEGLKKSKAKRSLRRLSWCKVLVFFIELGSQEFLFAFLEKLWWLCLSISIATMLWYKPHIIFFLGGGHAYAKPYHPPVFVCQRPMKLVFVLSNMPMLTSRCSRASRAQFMRYKFHASTKCTWSYRTYF